MTIGSGRSMSRWAGVGLVLLAAAAPLRAADRSVTILEGVEEPPPAAAPAPDAAAGAGAPTSAQTAALAAQNAAGLRLDILPNPVLQIGTQIAFSIATQQPGYLVIVDINAEGRLTQIYPNVMSLAQSSGNTANANMIRPGAPVTIPNPRNPLARFVFQADLPRGSGAIVAILSDRPVQIIDLPDIDATAGAQGILDGLVQAVSALKIASTDGTGKFTGSTWSFAATRYVIQ